MNPRLLILIVLAGGLAIFFATRASAPQSDDGGIKTADADESDKERLERERRNVIQIPAHKRPLPGSKPDVPPVFDVRVEVDPTGEKNRLFLYITEEHGYYVETLTIAFRYFDSPDLEWEDGTYVASSYLLDILKANETLKACADMTSNELVGIGGAMGDSSNWRAQVTKYGRARNKNPEKFPIIEDFGKCR
jgi:hypothetical protein